MELAETGIRVETKRRSRSGLGVSPWNTSVPSTTPNAVTRIRSP